MSAVDCGYDWMSGDIGTAAGVQLSRGYSHVAAGTTNFNISACFICLTALTTSAPMHT